MSTITKQEVQAVADLKAGYTLGHADVEILNELARIALASLTDESVLYAAEETLAYANMGELHLTCLSEPMGDAVIPLYTAPPEPVAVPPAIHDEDFEKALSVLNDTLDDCGDSERGLLLALDKAGIEVRSDACRAAMLQGADGNSPDCWVACSERMPERDVDVQVYCADKKEQMVGYMEHNEQDGYFRFASLPNGGGVYCQPTHWMPLPAAPQQEAKNV